MRLSTKAQYAVMAMVDIAHHGKGEPVSLMVIAGRQNLPLPYLEQLFNKLKRASLVVACRGATGGYLLERDSKTIFIGDIIAAVDRPLKATRCATNSHIGCQTKGSRCLTHDLWNELEVLVHEFLSRVSLYDVCNPRSGNHREMFGVPLLKKVGCAS